MSVTVYQVDSTGLFVHACPEQNSVGWLQVTVAPPAAQSGHVLQWQSTRDQHSDPAWASEGEWVQVEDNRKTPLWSAWDAPYTVGAEVNGQTYDGLGPVPAWLYTTEPEIPLATAQANQTALMYQGYQAAVTLNVSFETAAGVTQTYQADAGSQNTLLQAYTGFEAAGAVPAGFYWVAADNTQVPFTLADLKGLYGAMLAQGWAAFQHLQVRKASIRATTTSAAVKAIVW